ncbi:MAG: YHS domain-containing protein [Hahellaceae bacterium]|nr:YHS domain-containing protein [Hahellaceae bacterium]
MGISRFHSLATKILLVFSVVFSPSLFAKSPIYTAFFSDLAVSGYDTVAYFTEGKPVKGESSFSTEYQGAKWLFSSQAHLDKFKAEPQKYAPQYGGYCAWAVANNDTAKGDPLQWYLQDGKLYLNYDAEIRAKWLKDKDALIIKADANWPAVLH